MSAAPTTCPAEVGNIVDRLSAINTRDELIKYLGRLQLPHGLPESERARLCDAVIAAAARCWKRRFPG
jgi:hypothetical protein